MASTQRRCELSDISMALQEVPHKSYAQLTIEQSGAFGGQLVDVGLWAISTLCSPFYPEPGGICTSTAVGIHRIDLGAEASHITEAKICWT